MRLEGRIMGIGFYRYMMNCMLERVDDITNNVAANNKAFRKMTENIILLSNTMNDCLPPEYKKLFEELEDIREKRELIMYKKLYWQAVKDGVRISAMFHGWK